MGLGLQAGASVSCQWVYVMEHMCACAALQRPPFRPLRRKTGKAVGGLSLLRASLPAPH